MPADGVVPPVGACPVPEQPDAAMSAVVGAAAATERRREETAPRGRLTEATIVPFSGG